MTANDKNISFSRSESWKDYLGIHSVTVIRDGKKEIGQISGESGSAIPMMRYTVECAGIEAFSKFSLNEAKREVRARLSKVGE